MDESATVPAMSEQTHEELRAELLARIAEGLGLPPEIMNEANFDVAGVWNQGALDMAFSEWLQGLAPMPLLPGDKVPDYTEIHHGDFIWEWNGDAARLRMKDQTGEDIEWLDYDRATWVEDEDGYLRASFEIDGLATFTGRIDYVVVY